MPPALTLSTDSQNQITQAAEAAEKTAHAKARKKFLLSLGFFAAGAVVSAVFPPAMLPGLLSLASATAGVVAGAYGLGHKANEKMLSGIRQDAGKDGFADKMKTRAQRLKNIFTRSDKISDRSLYISLGLAAVAWLAPPVAPVAWGLYTLAVCVMAGATLVRAVSRDPNKTAEAINGLTEGLAARDGLTTTVQPANQNPAPALSTVPSPGPAFDKAVNAAPSADPAPAPVKTPAPPKP